VKTPAQSLSVRGLSRNLVVALVSFSFGSSCVQTTAEDPMTADPDAVSKGQALYVEHCSVCHGTSGQGVSAPALLPSTQSAESLRQIITERMPPGSPGRCGDSCAKYVTAYLKADMKAGSPTCAERSLGVRRLRLLTRKEYQNTITDLLPPRSTSCTAPVFSFDPQGKTLRSVHVAGSFNGWPGTLAAGGWPLTYSATEKRWKLTRVLDPGSYSYKFVLDEKDWVTDSSNPRTMPDGFGGQNSVLTVTCKPGGEPLDLTADLPPDARPEGYGFDNHSDARLVSTSHLEGFRKGAEIAAKQITDQLSSVLPCDPSGGRLGVCAEQFLQTFGLRAFRRPRRHSELSRYTALITSQKTFAEGISAAVQALLTSPYFLYRSELGELQSDGTYKLTGYEAASALSYLLWGTMPDDQLFAAAARGELLTPEQVREQAQRLLASPRSRSVIGAYGLSYLGAEDILTTNKSTALYPGFSESLRRAMAEETQRFVSHVVFDGTGRLDELFSADYSFVNAELGTLYAMSGVSGSALGKQSYGSTPRAGWLGHGSVLGSYAHSDQSSPIRRGLFVRRQLLCEELPPPPPNAGGVPQVDPNATTRERFRQHTSVPFCKSCHQYIDDVGFGFERFDAIGRWRESENGQPIDSVGDLNDREALGSLTHAQYGSLKALGQLLAESERARMCFVRKTLRYSQGTQEDVGEHFCTLWRLQNRFRDSGYRIQDLLLAIVEREGFLLRAASPSEQQGESR
jgi:mono/diheme cytochrome c family protein